MKKYEKSHIEVVELNKDDIVRTSKTNFENELPLVPFEQPFQS